MSKEKKSRDKLAKELTEKIAKIKDLGEIEKIIKENKIEFKIKDMTYRVRKPNFRERTEMDKLRSKKTLELIKDKDLKFREEWIKIYKDERNIDIEKIDRDIEELGLQIEDTKEKIGGTDSVNIKKRHEEEIDDLTLKVNRLIIDKKDKLENSIEDVLVEFSNTTLITLVLEKKEKDKWVKVFKDYEDLMNSDDTDLIILATDYIGALIFNPTL